MSAREQSSFCELYISVSIKMAFRFRSLMRPRTIKRGSRVEMLFKKRASRREVTPDVYNFLNTTQPASSSISVVWIPPCNVFNQP